MTRAPSPKKGHPKDRPWSSHHDAILVQMKDAGLTVEAIGDRLGRTPNAVASRAYQISVTDGVRPKPVRDILGDKIEAYLTRIAALNGFTLSTLKSECYGWR